MRYLSLLILVVTLSFSSVHASSAIGKDKGKKKGKKQQTAGQPQFDKATQGKLDRLFLDAEKAKVIEDMDAAIKSYQEVLTTDPGNANAHFQLAQIYMGQNKLNDAETEALNAARLDQSNKWYYEMLATIYMSEGKVKEATETFKTLIQVSPNNPDYYLNLGFLYSKSAQYDNAIKTYDQFEKNFGIDESVVQEKKNLFLRLNKFNDAVSEVQKLVDAFPGETNYMLMEADLFRANKMKDKASEMYKKVLAVEPDNPQALLALADLGMQSGNTQQGVENIKKIFENQKVDIDTKIKILMPYLQFWDVKKADKQDAFTLADALTKAHPTDAKGFAIKGDLYYLDGQIDTALSAYLASLTFKKDVYQVWQQVMVIYNQKKEWVALEKVCAEAADVFPNQAITYLFKGGAEYQNKEYDKAVKSYSKGDKMAGDNDKLRAQFLSNMGDAYHSLNKNVESDSAYERSLKLDPENAFVLNNYSYYLSLRKENLDRAKQMSAYSNKIEPDNSSFLDTYAWILFQLNDFTGAKDWQEKAMKASGEKSGTIIEHYGDILYKLGEKDKALEYWKKAKELGTDSGTIDKKISEQKYME